MRLRSTERARSIQINSSRDSSSRSPLSSSISSTPQFKSSMSPPCWPRRRTALPPLGHSPYSLSSTSTRTPSYRSTVCMLATASPSACTLPYSSTVCMRATASPSTCPPLDSSTVCMRVTVMTEARPRSHPRSVLSTTTTNNN